MIVVDVPVEAQGTSAGVKAGGRLQITSRTVRLRCAICVWPEPMAENWPKTCGKDVCPLAFRWSKE